MWSNKTHKKTENPVMHVTMVLLSPDYHQERPLRYLLYVCGTHTGQSTYSQNWVIWS